jgi:hypothetical protein
MEARAEELRARGERIAKLVEQVRTSSGPTTWPMVEALLENVLVLHGEALARIVREAEASGAQTLLRAMQEDELVSSLLRLHGVHPEPVRTRVVRALESLRPGLGVHVRELRLLEIDDEGRAVVAIDFKEKARVDVEQVERTICEAIEAEAPEVSEVRLVDEDLRRASLGIVSLGVPRP